MQEVQNVQDVVQFVNDLELEKPVESFTVKRTRGAVAPQLVKEGEDQAFLSDKSIVSFVSAVNGQNRKDILNSTLLAQLAANKKSPIEQDLTGWYKRYIDVLRNIGWVVENAEINNYEVREKVFEVEHVIIDILSASFGAGYIALIKKTLESLKQMSEQNDGRIKVFEKNTQSISKGCFQMALADEENDALSMKLGTFLLTSTNQIKQILFVKIKRDETKLEYASSQATLDTELYSMAARDAVIHKLSQDITDYIAEIEI